MAAVMFVVDELRLTDRKIVTNLSLKLPELCEYLHKTYGDTFNAASRIRILSEEETYSFWLYFDKDTEGGKLISRRKMTFERDGRRFSTDEVDYSPRSHCRVLYVIDEVHKFFSARSWASNGSDGFYYASEHRKFGDDVILITQFIGNVDKQLRSVAQDYTYVRNFKKERYGWFTSFPFMSRSTYSEPFTGGQIAMETKRYRVDTKGIGSCYDTASGVGVVGRSGADIGQRAKGIPIVFLFLLAALIPVAIFFGWSWFCRHGMPALAKKWTPEVSGLLPAKKPISTPLGDDRPEAAALRRAARVGEPVQIVPNGQGSGPVLLHPLPQSAFRGDGSDLLAEPQELGMSGYMSDLHGGHIVTLTDGRVLRTSDGSVQFLTPFGCVVGGQQIKIVKPMPAIRREPANVVRSGAGSAPSGLVYDGAVPPLAYSSSVATGEPAGWHDVRINVLGSAPVVQRRRDGEELPPVDVVVIGQAHQVGRQSYLEGTSEGQTRQSASVPGPVFFGQGQGNH